MSVSMVQPCPDDEESERGGRLQATIAALEAEIANLKVALRSARTIGIALGIIMAERKVTPDEAFEMLRVTSQHSHRKLRDVAEDVGLTGVVPDAPPEARCG